jgi:hypothetical protein
VRHGADPTTGVPSAGSQEGRPRTTTCAR